MAPFIVSVLMGFDCVAEMRCEKGFYFFLSRSKGAQIWVGNESFK